MWIWAAKLLRPARNGGRNNMNICERPSHILHLQYHYATCDRSLSPSELEEEDMSLSTAVICVLCVNKTLCVKLKCQTWQSSKKK